MLSEKNGQVNMYAYSLATLAEILSEVDYIGVACVD